MGAGCFASRDRCDLEFAGGSREQNFGEENFS
jgi:hypothetical protein